MQARRRVGAGEYLKGTKRAALAAEWSRSRRNGLGRGRHVGLFVLIAVGIVVAQTWLDWRHSKRDWVVPDWAKGMALAGMVGVSLTAALSFTSIWLQDQADQGTSMLSSRLFWMELGLLLCVMGTITFLVRRKRMRSMVLLGAAVAIAVWLGVALLS